jgi:hypothetical protein
VLLAGTEPALDSINIENVSEMKKEAEEQILHRLAMVYDFLKI